MKLIAAIFWYQKNKEIWYMIVDINGTYFGKPACINVGDDKKLISDTIGNIFTEIDQYISEGYDIEIRYKTFSTVASGIRKSLAKPNPESILVDNEIKKRIKKSKYSAIKKNQIETYQRKILADLLSPLLGKRIRIRIRIIDLWGIAFHKNTFKNLAIKLWKIVKNSTGLSVKKGDLKTKFEADYKRLLKDHQPKK
ncbi:MAG: hypothetical protein AB7D28_03685 [Candidatus Berkiella sp.]